MANRKHSKIDSFPTSLKDEVEFMIQSDYTYQEIVEYIKQNGYDVSLTSVYRYANNLNTSLKQLKMVQENFKAINEELRRYPDMDTGEGIIRLLSHQILERVQNMESEDLKDVDVLKLMKEANALIRTAAYKSKVDISNKDIMEAGYEKVKVLVFDVMQKEEPELYAKVSEFLNKKVDVIKESAN
ncbi:MAG: phage protein Gp27 family protein [Peptoanaerobacter stomatis]|uniref:phage protein Gp27 family protein n=1 Tax=Peptoanaerobacter stomatis TaxID=796937 RepID=UPI003FA0CBC6